MEIRQQPRLPTGVWNASRPTFPQRLSSSILFNTQLARSKVGTTIGRVRGLLGETRPALTFGGILVPVKIPPGLQPASMNSVPLAEVGVLLGIELDGGRVYLDDSGNLFALAEHAAIRDRFIDALNASGAHTGCPPLPLLAANLMAETAIAHLGRGRVVNPPKYTARDWSVPAGAD